MNYRDQLLITQAYTLIHEEKQIQNELNSLMLDEGVLDLLKQGKDAVVGAAAELSQNISQKASEISALPQQLAYWSQVQIPEYITKMGDFIINIGWAALAGGSGAYALGQMLMMLAKKMNKEAKANYDTLLSMLPYHVQEKIQEIEQLKEVDRKKYELAVFNIHKNAMIELKKNFNSKGIKTEYGPLAKSIEFLGKSLTSNAGMISGAITIPVLMYKLGFNPLPIFPAINP